MNRDRAQQDTKFARISQEVLNSIAGRAAQVSAANVSYGLADPSW